MPSRETPSYSSSRVQRASRLNALEQVRLQQKLMLLEKARLHQARLTNQDIRLTSIALDYILSSSGHSPEGRGPAGQQGGTEVVPQEDPCFLYGERVVSRKVRRMPRPQSAVERATFRRSASKDAESTATEGNDSVSVQSRLPPRPKSSPAKRRTWALSNSMVEEDTSGGSEVDSERPRSRGKVSPSSSRPPTAGSGDRGRTTPLQAWENDTDEITKRLLKAQRQQQQQQQQHQQQQQNSLRNNRYMQDISRMQSQSPGAGKVFPNKQNKGFTEPVSPFSSSPSPRVLSPGSPVIEDRKPVSPRQKRAKSAGLGRRAGLTEIMSQARATMSASAWRSHLASTQTVPRSAESQRQVIMEARRNAERQRQRQVEQKVETFIGTLIKNV